MRPDVRIFAFLIALSLGIPAFGAASARHLRLVKSEPADSAVIAVPPADVKLWFSEVTGLGVTKVTLSRGRDTLRLAPLARAKAETSSPIVARITGPVIPGAYTVSWRTMGKDGHVMNGTFGFKVAAAPPAGGAR